MDTLKRAQVIMLPTVDQSFIIKGNNVKRLIFTNITKSRSYANNQHLYITSDDEIRNGNWYLDSLTKILYQAGSEPVTMKCFKKIISSTDKSLGLPEPSIQFIKKYIESYNKGETITDVLVEHENTIINQCDCICHKPGYMALHVVPCCYPSIMEVTKVNPKDNTITIKKLKDTWSRNEVIEIVNYCWGYKNEGIQTKEEWIEKNL